MSVAVVMIGRNEGARFLACLASLKDHDGPLVYVDSGSDDGSVEAARNAGATVVELSPDQPFTAARARAEGAEALDPTAIKYVQFVDGDCAVEPGWIAAGVQALDDDETLGLVTGWRSEISPEQSIYNAIVDHEWHRPAGMIEACGGDMMVRFDAYQEVGGFDPTVIASEDDEFCVRLGKAGWGLKRLPVGMTRHDADMTRFGQWWQRSVRGGHGYAQVGHLHPPYFRKQCFRAFVYGAVLPVALILGALGAAWLTVAVLAIYAFSFWRTSKGLQAEGLPQHQSQRFAVFFTLSKLPNVIGMAVYAWRRIAHRRMEIIEYK